MSTHIFAGQSPFDVRYALYGPDMADNFTSKTLTCYASSYCEHGRFRIDCTIIGESHFIIIYDKKNNTRLSVEVYACVDTDSIGVANFSGDLTYGAIDRELLHKDIRIHTIAHIDTSCIERHDFHIHDDMHLQTAFLEYAFDDGKHFPRTQLGIYMIDDKVIETKTLHEYVTIDDKVIPLFTTTKYEIM